MNLSQISLFATSFFKLSLKKEKRKKNRKKKKKEKKEKNFFLVLS